MLTAEESLGADKRDKALVLSLSEVGKGDIGLVGGKGANLGEMLQAQINVPPGFVVTTKAYMEFMTANGLYQAVNEILSGVDINDSTALNKAADKIKQAIIAAPMPEKTKDAIRVAYEQLGRVPVAARSSATAEDLAEASFAGQQSTELNVQNTEQVLKAVQSCWASLFGARAIFYRDTNGFKHDEVSIAVVVQQMVSSEVSGVMFTVDPSTGNRDTALIEAIYGLGEPLVAGELSPDAYLVDKLGTNILSREIVSQPWLLHKNEPESGSYGKTTIIQDVPPPLQNLQKLSDEHIAELARTGSHLERLYEDQPQDIEWALENGRLYIVQSRPITTINQPPEVSYDGFDDFDAIITGAAASPGVAAGRVKVIRGPSELDLVKQGDILVTEMTTPDFVPAMHRAAAIVTDRGGRTCHAAIVSREMSIPCIVGTSNATQVLRSVPVVTVDGSAGKVYKGDLVASLTESAVAPVTTEAIKTRTRLYVNLAAPDAAERVAKMDVDGVGLLRAEFIMAHIGEHPRAMLETGRGDEFISRLSEGLEIFARAFHPRPVVYRFSDFKTNEYRNLKGGEAYEAFEENPMLGYRGCSRYLAEPDLLALEVEAVNKVREKYNNLWVMLPFVRTVGELRGVKNLLEKDGLESSEDFKLWMMLELPSNVLLLDEFLNAGVDGVSIGSNDLTQLVLGVDRDNERLADTFDERDPAVLVALEKVVKGCAARGITASICGQAPSEYPELTRKLVSWGITSVSVSPDMVQETRQVIHQAEEDRNNNF